MGNVGNNRGVFTIADNNDLSLIRLSLISVCSGTVTLFFQPFGRHGTKGKSQSTVTHRIQTYIRNHFCATLFTKEKKKEPTLAY
jgi:hypothetical protein